MQVNHKLDQALCRPSSFTTLPGPIQCKCYGPGIVIEVVYGLICFRNWSFDPMTLNGRAPSLPVSELQVLLLSQV